MENKTNKQRPVMNKFNILVHNGYRFEYHSAIEARSVADARKKWKAYAAPSETRQFRVVKDKSRN